MAKRMGFSVIGLPHYTIWHLYEPSVDDLRHMEEMEQERKEREMEEKDQADRAERVQTLFKDAKTQWDIDHAFVEDAIAEDQKQETAASGSSSETLKGSEEGPLAQPAVKERGGAGQSGEVSSTQIEEAKR